MILRLSHCEHPYEIIANYIKNHSKVIEDMIAVIEIDGVRINEFLEYDFDNDSFMFQSDWWEGEQEVTLIDFFPVSEACNPKTSIPIEWIEKWLSDRSSCLERTPSEIHIKQIISDWQAENRRNKND